MWHRKSILLLLCVSLLFIFSSVAFCQSHEIPPIKGFLSADSVGVRATQVPNTLHPARIGLPGVVLELSIPSRDTLQGPVLSPEPKCQWVRFQFSSTNWKWFMRKPGTYGGQVLIGSIQSNGDVCVDFSRFSKLRCTDGSGERLKTFYAISPPTSDIDEVTWMKPNQLNNYILYFDPHPIVPATWALWQKVVVKDSSPAAEFKDKAIISINLVNNPMWVDSKIGNESYILR